ncbi:MAG TPA: carboxypeptidase-like regulatory domain-containing protein [Pyrinomonadaceae bacterium]|nr:carboxypeptidase-like regulatory domain-containing protein [Pyrinomonadaceae bacterium]
MSKAAAFSLLLALGFVPSAAQKATTGGIKGKVRVDSSATPSGISVTARQGEREVARATTNGKGEFELRGLAPGAYGLTFHKPGLSIGRMENVEVRAGKVRSLDGHLFLTIDEGSLAFLSGFVVSQEGRSIEGARVELALLLPDGSLRKIDSRVTTETGSFRFRLSPAQARYRVSVRADRMETATQDVEIDSAEVYRVALTLVPAAK